MKHFVLLCAAFALFVLPSFSQGMAGQRRAASLANMRAGGQRPDRYGGTTLNSDWDKRLATVTKRTDGYVVYKNDTLRGLIVLTDAEVQVEQPIDEQYSTFYLFHLKNTDLKTIMMYNTDKKPLCLSRVTPKDKRMLRVVHSGKLNIYDDRIAFVYAPSDIDKNYIIISYDGVVDDLSSFLTENTKRDLIGYVNDVYGIKIDPKTINWQELLTKVDMLD